MALVSDPIEFNVYKMNTYPSYIYKGMAMKICRTPDYSVTETIGVNPEWTPNLDAI